MRIIGLFLPILLAVSLNPLTQAHGGLNREWRELTTPHFRILFDAKHKGLAEVYGRAAERARASLLQYYTHAPDVTALLLDDSTDSANGYAMALPYPFLRIFPVLPSPYDSIGEYEDWIFELLVHEYAHLLTFEPSLGLYSPFRYIFGNIARPNLLLPRWYHEGVSVFWETHLSSRGGRLRSLQQQGDLRALVLGKQLTLEKIGRWNDALPDWVGGGRPYLYGGLLFNNLYSRSEDPRTMDDLTLHYARRLPYLLQEPVVSRWGETYQTLASDLFAQIELRAQDQIDRIAQTTSEGAWFIPEQEGLEWRNPKFSPDGRWLAAIHQGANSKYQIVFFRLTENSLELQKDSAFPADKRILSFSWAPDSKTIIFDRISSYKREAQFYDLYSYSLETRRTQRLTHGLRSMEPSVSPDGTTVVFRQNYPEGTRIAQIQVDGKNPKVLYTPPRLHRVSSPHFLGNEQVVFSERNIDGHESLRRLTLGQVESQPSTLHGSLAPALFPRVTPHGLLFQSSASGVPNLYLETAQGSVRSLTNSPTRVINGDLHPFSKTLAYSEVTPEGSRIKLMRPSDYEKVPRNLPLIPPLVEVNSSFKATDPPLGLEMKERPYRPLRYMLPRYWMPFLFFQEEGFTVQALTSHSDPSLRHQYSLQASYDNLSEKIGALGQYSYLRSDSSWTLLGGKVYEYILSGGFTRSVDLAQASVSFFAPGLSDHWRGRVGVVRSKVEYGALSLLRSGPELGISYAKIEHGPDRVTPEGGGGAELSWSKYLSQWGNLSYDQTSFLGQLYHSKGLPPGHGLAGFLRGQYAPSLNQALLGGTSLGGVYQFSLVSGSYLMRGYPTGSFIGKNVVNASLEYRLPLTTPYQGWGTLPLFFRRSHLNLFIDTMAVDGLAYNFQGSDGPPGFRTSSLDQFFASAGLEYKWDLTLGYMAPAQVFIGLYYGLDQEYGGGFTPFLGFLF